MSRPPETHIDERYLLEIMLAGGFVDDVLFDRPGADWALFKIAKGRDMTLAEAGGLIEKRIRTVKEYAQDDIEAAVAMLYRLVEKERLEDINPGKDKGGKKWGVI